MMQIEQIAHDIAFAAAKASCDSNLPEYQHNSGVKGYALDMVKNYVEAYEIAESELKEALPKKKSTMQVLK